MVCGPISGGAGHLIHLGFRHLDSLPDAPGAPTLRRSMEEGGQAQAQGTSPPAQGWRCAWRRSWRSYLVPSLTPLASQTLPASAAARRRAGAGGSRVLSSRQKAKTCSDFCRLADAKSTCAAAKTRSSLARTPTQGDATRGRAALQSARELVGDSRSENHNLKVDRFQGCRSL